MQNLRKCWFGLADKIRFLIVGCFNAAVSYTFYVVFCLLFGAENYQLALILSWVLSSFISFSTQKYLVFESKGSWLKEYSKCCMTWCISYVMNALILEFFIRFMVINVYLAQIISTLSVAILTYFLFKNFAFRHSS